MLERPDAKALTKAQHKWLAVATVRPIKRSDFRRCNRAIDFLANRGFLQLVAGPRGRRGDMWHITDAGRAMRPTQRHPTAKISWSAFAKDVRSFRLEHEMGVREMSRTFGIPSPTISRLERERLVDAETFTFRQP